MAFLFFYQEVPKRYFKVAMVLNGSQYAREFLVALTRDY